MLGTEMRQLQQSAESLICARAPHANFTYVAAPLASNISPTPGCKPEDADAIYRNLEASQRRRLGQLAAPADTSY